MTPSPISIKGVREGLLVTLGDGPFARLAGELGRQLAEKQGFFRGSRVLLAVGDRALDAAQLAALQALFAREEMELWTVLAADAGTREAAREQGLATRMAGSQTDLEGKPLPPPAGETGPAPASPSAPGVLALYLRETIRSGRSIDHDGPVVIMGDVNPGAEIIAGGDVIVWGKVRGLVHAGAYGDASASICALELSPTQLRIAGQIAIPPEEKRGSPMPERAAIRGGRIVAEPWPAR